MREQEPLVTAGVIVSLIAAGLVLMRSFGVPITPDQEEAVKTFVAILAPLVLAAVARQFVFAPATVDRKIAESYVAGRDGEPPPPR